MKKRLTLFGLFVALAAFSTHAQIYQYFSQDFETGTTQNYTLTGSANVQTSIVSGGSRSLKMTHTQNATVTMVLDTIDLTQNATLNYFTLEFQHIAFVDPLKCADRTTNCYIEVWRPGQTSWTRLGNTQYNQTDGGSSMFADLSSFNKLCYDDWDGSNSVNNTLWKSERFDLENVFQGTMPQDRKLVIRFVVVPRTTATSTDAWYIDDIKVRASSQPIVAPRIAMRTFPDQLNYPSSRGARIVADVSTTVSQGINSDSVYILYRVGNSPTVNRTYMTPVPGVAGRFQGHIPFVGYDTLIHYHMVLQDSTVNHNTSYFPKNPSQWKTYRCVRGYEYSAAPSDAITPVGDFPLPTYADNRSEWIYDSVTMANLGYRPGSITNFAFKVSQAPRTVTRPRLQIRMANVTNNILRTASNESFSVTDMQIVYDSAFVAPQASRNSLLQVHLQDTFHYAGSDLLVQFIYDGNVNTNATTLYHIPVVSNKNSLYIQGHPADMDFNTFTALGTTDFSSGIVATSRPWMQIYAQQNVPLINDCGICAMAYPSYEVPCNTGNDSVVVWLKNFGVQPVNSIRIGYRIDNAAPVYYNWTGNLAAGDSVRVKVNQSQNFTVGYHTVTAWVDDTITSGTGRYRDHEPYNDTTFTPFAACNGPYSGQRTVGTGSGAHFASLDKCLYVLSRCGINGVLTVKLPNGVYDVTKFPFIPGTSASNYVVFEPAAANGSVTFRRSAGAENENAPMLVDMEDARSIRFNHIKFVNGTSNTNRCDVLVQLGRNSSNCQFLNCQFVDSNSVTASAEALLHSGGADSLTIRGCYVYGGKTGIHLQGNSTTVTARKNVVQFTDFLKQVNIALKLENLSGLLVDSNYMNDVLTNAGPFIIYGNHLYEGSRIVRNRVYSSKGASCIGVSNVYGTPQQFNYVANNMMVSLDDGTSNQLVTPLNIIRGDYLKVVFNSVRMRANSRVNIAAATLGGDTISNTYFQNNVVATFDTTNYAFNFIPLHNQANLHVDHNCYYSESGVINKCSSVNYTNMNAWRNQVPTDLGSVNGDPLYTNSLPGTRVDLRSFNVLLRNKGVAIPGVTDDIEGTTRHATTPSLGAYEVSPLQVDLIPFEFITPMEDYCGAPSNIPMKVSIKNTGIGTCTGTINVSYSIDGGQIRNFTISGRTIPAGDTLQYTLNRTENFPCNSDNSDRTYSILWWVRNNNDPDNLNDTSTWTVISRYAPPAPTVINQNVPYAQTATITPTGGINTWPVNYYTNATAHGRMQKSGISWFRSMTDTVPFFYGPTLTTGQLYNDTTVYISQKRNLPLMKITEVQVNRTATGCTSPMPSWLNSQTAFAVQLTNCGDYPANLDGDSVVVVQTSGANKIWVLPNVTIQPGNSIVLQFKAIANVAVDSTQTLYCPSTAVVAPAYTTAFGVIYRDKHGVADAVPFNNILTSSNWTGQVPSTYTAVWKGTYVDLAKNGNTQNTATAGAYRATWPTSAPAATPSNSKDQWVVATNANPMHIGTTNPALVIYEDNGCEGQRSAVNLHITNRPTTDVAVDVPVVDTGCNLTTNELVQATVHNYGTQTATNINVKMSLNNGATVYSTATIASISSQGSQTVTFPQGINMHQNSDSVFHVKVWVNALTSDQSRANDTNSGDFFSAYTPNQPTLNAPTQVAYGNTATINTTNVLQNKATCVWYDAAHRVLDTVRTGFVTPHIYHNPDTFFVKAIGLRDEATTHIGTLATVMNNNFPSPYNPKVQYVREQYLIPAAQIAAAGHHDGTISSLSFYLEALGSNVNSFTFSDYTIKMGTTTTEVFPNTNFITAGMQQVYHRTGYTLSAADLGWVKHELDTPFQWDGTSSVVVEIIRTLSTTGITAGANTRYTAQANTVITKSGTAASVLTSTTGTKGNNRPDVKIGFLEAVGCESPETQVMIGVSGMPNIDATIDFDPALDTMVIASCAATPLNVVISCRGTQNINAYTLRYKVDNSSWQTTNGNANNLAMGYSRTVPLMSQALTPGRHTVTAVIRVTGDNVTSNDTIVRTFNVRFCDGTYTIGSGAGKDYPSMTVAIDTLQNAGVAGNVTFLLSGETFSQQLSLGAVNGTSDSSRVVFTTDPAASNRAMITFNPTQASNYVMALSGTRYVTFRDIDFYAGYTGNTGTSAYASVLRLANTENVKFSNCTIRSKASKATNGNITAASTNANLVLIDNGNSYLTIDSCVLDSGYYAIRTLSTNTNSYQLHFSENTISNFLYQGIYLRNCDTVYIDHDSITSGTTIAGKAMTGILVANGRNISVKRNFVLLMDNATGGKRGIELRNIKGTNIDRSVVYNNMVSLKGTAVASLSSSGIYIDSTSKYMNVYFNSVRLYAGATQAATRAFSVSKSSQIHVMNNIFDNESKGYAYYVDVDTNVAISNYNVYWSNSEVAANGTRKYVHWGNVTATADRTCLDSLRTYNHQDVNSKEEQVYFRSERDLKLALAQFFGLGQYNPDVMVDIFNTTRNQIPPPTIGCHEFYTRSCDLTVAAILEPHWPTAITGNNAEVLNIETDSILVRVQLYNNGSSPLRNVTWHAYIAGTDPQVTSYTRTIRSIPVRTMVEDSLRLASPLGIQDSQWCVVVADVDSTSGCTFDEYPFDNVDSAHFFIYPAYDLRVTAITITDNDPSGCRLFNVPINYTIKNEGKKDFPADFTFQLGYDFYVPTPPAGFDTPNNPAPNYPGMGVSPVETFGTVLPVGTDLPITINAQYWPNMYPTNFLGDLRGTNQVKLRGWVTYENDIKPLNDTTNYINVVAKHTPPMPIGHDTLIDYGSYGVLTAVDSDGVDLTGHNVIRWCRDTTSGNCFFNGNNNYVRSKRWETSPQFFHDSTYYLCCISSQGCTSYYSEIHVGVNPPLPYDVSISEVPSPRASGRVYSEIDTVRLRVVNYGSQPATNIPITYEFYTWANNRTTLRQTCTDTVRVTIPGRVGDNVAHYDFVFDTSLLNLKALNPNVATSSITYKLNAWVSMPGDMQTNNDTLHQLHTFITKPETVYNYAADSLAPTGLAGFDITHVSYNELDTWMPDMIGYNHLTLGSYNANNAEIPTLYVRRGTTDTLTVEVANNMDEMDSSTAASLLVAVDYNRDGYYELNGSENITMNGQYPGVKVHSRRPYQMEYTIPEDCQYGYMRMMVWVVSDSAACYTQFPSQTENGQMQEYLIFVQEPGTEDSIDGALTRVVTRGPIVTENDHYVGVMLANKGKTDINAATIQYSFNNIHRSNQTGSVEWSGILHPGESQMVMLDSITFLEGTTDLTCTLQLPGDTIHIDNNVLEYRFHRYYVLTLRFIDSFDQLIDKWYVPAGYNKFTRNYWDRNTPAKATISTAASLPNAYVTDATRTIQTGTRGNRSYLYLPIINIAQIHPDSISFSLSKNLMNESYLWMEYLNYENKWVKMDDPGARYDLEQAGWYDDATGWTGSTPAGSYENHSLSTSSTGVSGDFPQRLRLRFVYYAPQGATSGASYGDGCAIDNFRLGRARRAVDVGVTEITHPTDPRFGQTIWPKVKIKNFGTGPMVNFKVAYRPWGTYLPMEEIVTDSIYPEQEMEFEFHDPFVVRNDFPDTFQICAFTKVGSDYYDDNDTTCQMFGLAPLDNDMYMYDIVEPLDRAVAGDSIFITVRLRNFGQAEVPDCDVAYKWNDEAPVVEHIDFTQVLGRPLASTEFFNYTFHHRERASMGTMELTTWCNYSNDAYRYNDTTSMQIGGISAITDIRSTEVVVNNNFGRVQVNLVLDNVGARMANDFEVGYMWDNNPDSVAVETFHRDGGLAAGGRAVHGFNRLLPGRSAAYEYITAWCVVPDDYNSANDTSVNNLVEPYDDIAAIKVEVEENRNDSCRVRMQVCNMGNVTRDPSISGAADQVRATINGKTIITSSWTMLEPGVPRYINFESKVPKSPTRTYVGNGVLYITDGMASNNTTSRVEVVNYFEGVPTVVDDDFVLEQNFPNPFDGKTRIEFNLPAPGAARFFVTDVVGRMVYEKNANYEAGRHTVTFDRSDLAAGVYYYAVEFNGETRMHKMIVR